MTRFGKILLLWWTFESLWPFLEGLQNVCWTHFGKCYSIRQILYCRKGLDLEKIICIMWSHWLHPFLLLWRLHLNILCGVFSVKPYLMRLDYLSSSYLEASGFLGPGQARPGQAAAVAAFSHFVNSLIILFIPHLSWKETFSVQKCRKQYFNFSRLRSLSLDVLEVEVDRLLRIIFTHVFERPFINFKMIWIIR